jgi:DNA-binding FrmR family transcriptional regulator
MATSEHEAGGSVVAACGCGVEHGDDEQGRKAHAVDAGVKDRNLKRLRRIEGQIRGLQRMVENDQYCIDILTQVSAATRALQSFSLGLLDEHLAGCVVDAAQKGGPEADAKVREASEAIARLVRS